jgi:DNA-binding transcriptional regulator YdaS (Cro superfamily)
MQTLWLALKRYGGEPALAKALGVSNEVLSGWLGGHDTLPAAMYLKTRGLMTSARR